MPKALFASFEAFTVQLKMVMQLVPFDLLVRIFLAQPTLVTTYSSVSAGVYDMLLEPIPPHYRSTVLGAIKNLFRALFENMLLEFREL